MACCKDCIHYGACDGYTPSDLDRDVFDYCRDGRADEIPDIEERCSAFMNAADVVPREEVDRLRHMLDSYAIQYGTVKDQRAVIDRIKAETAMEIFVELKEKYTEYFFDGTKDIIAFRKSDLAELEKKYTDEV